MFSLSKIIKENTDPFPALLLKVMPLGPNFYANLLDKLKPNPQPYEFLIISLPKSTYINLKKIEIYYYYFYCTL